MPATGEMDETRRSGMADVTEPVRRSRRRGETEASKPKQEVEQAPKEEPRDQDQDQQDQQSDGSAAQDDGAAKQGGDTTLIGELRSAIRDAAIEVLKPVARQATTSAAKYA